MYLNPTIMPFNTKQNEHETFTRLISNYLITISKRSAQQAPLEYTIDSLLSLINPYMNAADKNILNEFSNKAIDSYNYDIYRLKAIMIILYRKGLLPYTHIKNSNLYYGKFIQAANLKMHGTQLEERVADTIDFNTVIMKHQGMLLAAVSSDNDVEYMVDVAWSFLSPYIKTELMEAWTGEQNKFSSFLVGDGNRYNFIMSKIRMVSKCMYEAGFAITPAFVDNPV